MKRNEKEIIIKLSLASKKNLKGDYMLGIENLYNPYMFNQGLVLYLSNSQRQDRSEKCDEYLN